MAAVQTPKTSQNIIKQNIRIISIIHSAE